MRLLTKSSQPPVSLSSERTHLISTNTHSLQEPLLRRLEPGNGNEVIESKEEKTTASPSKTKLWQNWNFTDNLLYTIVSTAYTTSSILTPLCGFKELGMAGSGLSVGGMVGSLPLSLFFGYCVAYAHGDVVTFFARIDDTKEQDHHHHHGDEANEDPELEAIARDIQPTTLQKVRAWGHAVSDVYGSMAGIILFGETALAATPLFKRAFTYTLFCAWKCGSNKVEFDNVITSCKKENARTLMSMRGSNAV